MNERDAKVKEEGLSKYRLGGFHPLCLGEVYGGKLPLRSARTSVNDAAAVRKFDGPQELFRALVNQWSRYTTIIETSLKVTRLSAMSLKTKHAWVAIGVLMFEATLKHGDVPGAFMLGTLSFQMSQDFEFVDVFVCAVAFDTEHLHHLVSTNPVRL